jgi:hypothetical protein
MKMVSILFAASPSVYDELDGCEVYNKERDAMTFPGGMPIVAHPPCAQWGRLRYFAKDDPKEKAMAVWAVEQVRACGGVLEHPVGSSLWREVDLPRPGSRDAYGGFTLPVDQSWFGHRARKPTLLYIVGIEPRCLPDLNYSMNPPSAVIETEIRGRPGALPAVSRRERYATPLPFAEWLVSVARSAAILPLIA